MNWYSTGNRNVICRLLWGWLHKGVDPVAEHFFSSTQLAIIAAVVVIIADIIGLFSAVSAFNEEQASADNNKKKLEDICKYIQDKLNS